MRQFLAAALLLAALTTFGSAGSPALAYDGCLGAKVTACLDAIRPFISELDYRSATLNIDKFLAGDIAGTRKARGSIIVTYHSKFSDRFDPPQLLSLEFSQPLTIVQIGITLRKGAGTAETDSEYGATHMYEAAVFVLGSRQTCPEMATAHDFYLFFHKNIRPKTKVKKPDHTFDSFKPPSELEGESGWIGMCGNSVNYVVSSAQWGAVRENMERKYGSYVASLYFR
jgi:hypothetical protein